MSVRVSGMRGYTTARCEHCGLTIALSPAGHWFHEIPWRRRCVNARTLAKPRKDES